MNDEIRYRGRTPGEAMKKARIALGENARLVDARRVSGRNQFPMYEVRVLPPSGDDEPSIRDLPRPPHEADDPASERWFEVLRQRGASVAAAREIVETAGREAAGRQGLFQALRQTIAERFGDPALAIPPGERSTVLVGPTGAGKTTVLSRLATERVHRGDRPILVSTDGESIAGEDSLRSVAEALGLRFETAFLEGQLASLTESPGSDEIWFVDTPGRAPHDDEGLAAMKRLVRSLADPEVLLVMPASTDVDPPESGPLSPTRAERRSRSSRSAAPAKGVLCADEASRAPFRVADANRELRPIRREAGRRRARGREPARGAWGSPTGTRSSSPRSTA